MSLSTLTAFCFAGAFFLDAAGVPLDFAVKAKGLDAADFTAVRTTGFLVRFAVVGLGV